MSKPIAKFFTMVGHNFDIVAKLTASWTPGSRIVPSRTAKNDEHYQLRIDAGVLVDERYRNVYLQVNSQATASALKDWDRKNGTDANLAAATFDTKADDLEEESERVLQELEAESKKAI